MNVEAFLSQEWGNEGVVMAQKIWQGFRNVGLASVGGAIILPHNYNRLGAAGWGRVVIDNAETQGLCEALEMKFGKSKMVTVNGEFSEISSLTRDVLSMGRGKVVILKLSGIATATVGDVRVLSDLVEHAKRNVLGSGLVIIAEAGEELIGSRNKPIGYKDLRVPGEDLTSIQLAMEWARFYCGLFPGQDFWGVAGRIFEHVNNKSRFEWTRNRLVVAIKELLGERYSTVSEGLCEQWGVTGGLDWRKSFALTLEIIGRYGLLEEPVDMLGSEAVKAYSDLLGQLVNVVGGSENTWDAAEVCLRDAVKQSFDTGKVNTGTVSTIIAGLAKIPFIVGKYLDNDNSTVWNDRSEFVHLAGWISELMADKDIARRVLENILEDSNVGAYFGCDEQARLAYLGIAFLAEAMRLSKRGLRVQMVRGKEIMDWAKMKYPYYVLTTGERWVPKKLAGAVRIDSCDLGWLTEFASNLVLTMDTECRLWAWFGESIDRNLNFGEVVLQRRRSDKRPLWFRVGV